MRPVSAKNSTPGRQRISKGVLEVTHAPEITLIPHEQSIPEEIEQIKQQEISINYVHDEQV